MDGPARIAPADPTSWQTFDLRGLLPSGGGRVLDLGCGPGARRDLTGAGFRYVGLDVALTAGVQVVGRAESLPFGAESFDLVVAASSFEHFPDPWAAAAEVARVLRPGGTLVASVSFLEPYHARSHFHMSHLGVTRLLNESGLTVEELRPFEWTGVEAAAQAMLQTRLARWAVVAWVRPVLWARRLLVRLMVARMSPGPKRERAQEFLREEPFRFTAGIKVRARRPEEE